MKIDPLNILLNENYKFDKNFYLVSGNEATLMQKIVSKISKGFKNSEIVKIEDVKNLDFMSASLGLFGERKIYLCTSNRNITKDVLEKLKLSNINIIFEILNSQQLKKFKSLLLKRNDSLIIDCYELDKQSKIKLLNNFLNHNNISLDQEAYWLLVDNTDDRYIFFENELEKLKQICENKINADYIKKIITINTFKKEKLFFDLLKRNRDIVKLYREKIINTSDANDLYYYCKFYCNLIINCQNERDYLDRIPKYLFREKKLLLELFKMFNSSKKKSLLNLMDKTEKQLRTEGSLSIIFGLRFLLGLKKIAIF